MRQRDIFHHLVYTKCPQQPRLGWLEARNLELHVDFHIGGKDPKTSTEVKFLRLEFYSVIS